MKKFLLFVVVATFLAVSLQSCHAGGGKRGCNSCPKFSIGQNGVGQ